MEQKLQSTTALFIIRATERSLSFAFKKDNAADIAYETYETRKGISIAANLREAFRTSDLLRMAGLRVTVLIDSPVLLMPVNEYDEKLAEEQYHYVFPSQEGSLVVKHVLPSFKDVAVFSLSKDLNTVLTDHFEHIRIEPLMARLWEYLLQRSYGSNNKQLYAYFHENKMEVCSFTHNRFVFSNSFEVKDTHDALYFLLGVWKQIGGKAMTDDLFLAGKIPNREVLTNDAQEFLRRVYYINPSADFNRASFTQVENMPFDTMMMFNQR